MYILKYIGAVEGGFCPPYFKEYAYNETVEVIDSIAHVNHQDTRDLLTKYGYVDITSEYNPSISSTEKIAPIVSADLISEESSQSSKRKKQVHE